MAQGRARPAAVLAAGLFVLALCAQCRSAAADTPEAAADTPAAQGATREALRAYEAPAFASVPKLPPPPPEYLSHDQDGVRFVYHPSARDRVRALIDEVTVTRAELRQRLGVDVLHDVEVRVAVGSADFSRVVPAGAPNGSSVLAFGQLPMLALNLGAGVAAGGSDVRAAFRRGMALLALDEATALQGMPRWFQVGFALSFAGQARLSRARALWWASMRQRLIPVVDLDWYLADGVAYDSVAAAEAADFVGYLQDDEHADHFREMLSAIRADPPQPFDAALRAAYQTDERALEASWREHLARHKAFLPILFGGTLLWIMLALGVTVRRRLREPAKSKQQAEPAVVHVAVAAEETKPTPRPRRRPPPKAEPPEPEVPKVSHNGRWHTLH